MGRVLAISSQVVRGHVGLSAMVPALQRLGHEVLAMPTVLLSNHPGHDRATGTRIEVNTLVSMFDVLDANGWLADMDAVITGYMPSAAHVDFAVQAIERTRARNIGVRAVVDPVAGDDPRGLYIAEDAAEALRSRLVPLADIITPNRFELSWLTGVDVRDVRSATAACDRLGGVGVVATSIPDAPDALANVCVAPGQDVMVSRVALRTAAPKGTGDLLTGAFVGHLCSGASIADAMALAVGAVQHAVGASGGASDLVLTGIGPDCWSNAGAAKIDRFS